MVKDIVKWTICIALVMFGVFSVGNVFLSDPRSAENVISIVFSQVLVLPSLLVYIRLFEKYFEDGNKGK